MKHHDFSRRLLVLSVLSTIFDSLNAVEVCSNTILPGSKGDLGEGGDEGDQGRLGKTGPPGLLGLTGELGDKGEVGRMGKMGSAGDKDICLCGDTVLRLQPVHGLQEVADVM
ncbi:collectin-10-like [Salvelinus namaycush]|uniref:Collectin-10-like n=1 Tax=Salvelinus namaycush TaxID=8040 RepID=A0A8U0UE31_SALNM|nr:collectin-10-like [Salvelinus namaycush]